MAVPFCLPDPNPDERAGGGNAGGSAASQPSSGSSSAIQSPLQSPVSDAYFVQAFYEALYRCTQGGLPETPVSPLSPNQDGCGYNNRFYFPQTQRTSMTPTSVSPVSRGRVIVTPIPQRVYVPRRIRLSSIGDDESDIYEDVIIEYESEDDNQSERDDLMIHLRHMEAREQMQMFQGRVPPPKKSDRRKTEQSSSSCSNNKNNNNRNNNNNNNNCNKKISNQDDDKPKQKDSFRWPTVVTAFVLAVGCGILVSR